MLRLLRSCDSQDPRDEPQLLAACLSSLKAADPTGADPVRRANARIRNALRVIEPYERMYQCASYVFDQVRHRATNTGRTTLQEAMEESPLRDACAQINQASSAFLAQLEPASSDDNILGSARQALQKIGLVALAQALSATEVPIALGQEILRRHMRVQEGKFDGGLPKGPWVRLETETGTEARLTSQRFGLEPSQVKDSWREMTRHPYRTFGARRFIRLCKIQ
jgi:hypothetical protein